jgi:hypothetical protein
VASPPQKNERRKNRQHRNFVPRRRRATAAVGRVAQRAAAIAGDWHAGVAARVHAARITLHTWRRRIFLEADSAGVSTGIDAGRIARHTWLALLVETGWGQGHLRHRRARSDDCQEKKSSSFHRKSFATAASN